MSREEPRREKPRYYTEASSERRQERESSRNESKSSRSTSSSSSHGKSSYEHESRRKELIGESRRHSEKKERSPESTEKRIRELQRKDVRATDRMVEYCREMMSTGANVDSQLDVQSEKLSRAELHAVKSDLHVQQSNHETRELKKYGKLIAVDMFSFKKSKESRDLKEVSKRADELGRLNLSDSESPSSRSSSSDPKRNELLGSSRSGKNDKSGRSSGESRISAAASKDRDFQSKEKRIDRNLDNISQFLGDIKEMSMGLQAKIGAQNGQIQRISSTAERVDNNISETTRRLKKIK